MKTTSAPHAWYASRTSFMTSGRPPVHCKSREYKPTQYPSCRTSRLRVPEAAPIGHEMPVNEVGYRWSKCFLLVRANPDEEPITAAMSMTKSIASWEFGSRLGTRPTVDETYQSGFCTERIVRRQGQSREQRGVPVYTSTERHQVLCRCRCGCRACTATMYVKHQRTGPAA